MDSPGRTAITFTLNGRRYELSREAVATRLLGVAPEMVRKHAVRVNSTWFPVIQAFESATGIPQHQFGQRQHATNMVAAGQLGHHTAVSLVHVDLAEQGV